MITNENFTVDMLKELRHENIRLNKIKELNAKLNSETETVINEICCQLFQNVNRTPYHGTLVVCKWADYPDTIQWNYVYNWFKIQGFNAQFNIRYKEVSVVV